MKIYAARVSRNYTLDHYVGKDVWLLVMDDETQQLHYVQLIKKLADAQYVVHYTPIVSMIRKNNPRLKQLIMRTKRTYKIRWDSSQQGNYDLTVERPLDIITTEELFDMIPGGRME